MAFFCIRHPKLEHIKGICYGDLDIDPPIHWSDCVESVLVQLQMLKPQITTVYTSPLRRCRLFAEAIADKMSIKVIVDARLKEMNFGDWEGQSFDALWHEDMRYQHWCEHWQYTRCPNGESLIDLTHRVRAFMGQALPDHKTLIVTHAGVIRVLQHHCQHESLDVVFSRPVEYATLIKVVNND